MSGASADPRATVLDQAIAYARAGLHVFPLHRVIDGACTCGRACASPGKHPRTPRGHLDATADVGTVQSWGALWREANIGISLAASGLWVLDIDYRPDTERDGLPWLRYRQERHGEIQTAIARTGSGGLHYYFRGARSIGADEVPQTQNRLDVGVDTVSRGYAVAPPSVHSSGAQYEWITSGGLRDLADPPQWLVDEIRQLLVPTTAERAHEPRPIAAATTDDPAVRAERISRARSYADSAAPAVSGSGGSTQTFSVAQHLFGFGIDSADVLDIMRDHYNPRCQPPWSDREIARKVSQARDRSRATRAKDPGIIEAARAARVDVSGLLRTRLISDESDPAHTDTARALDVAPEDPSAGARSDEIRVSHPALDYDEIPPGIPSGLIDDAPRGVRDVARWILDSGIKPTPSGALGASLTLLASVIGLRFKTPTATRCNIYAVHVAPTGAGKDNQRSLCQKILTHPTLSAYGTSRILGSEEIGSDQGLIHEIAQHRERLYLLDELGHSLRRWTARGAGGWEQGIKHCLTKLYSASIYAGRAVVSSEPVQIRDPHVCVWGCSTPEQWYDSLEAGSVEDGFLNRFLVFEDFSHPPKTIGPDFAARSREIPDAVLGVVRDIVSLPHPGEGDLAGVSPSGSEAQSVCVGATPGAWADLQRVQREYDSRIGTPTGPLWVRGHLHVLRIATIAAVAERPQGPEIDESHTRYAIALVERLVGRQAQQAELRIAGSGREARLQLIQRAIRQADGAATRATIARATPGIPKREREELLEELVSNGQLCVFNDHFTIPMS